jgi:hypothetical protein
MSCCAVVLLCDLLYSRMIAEVEDILAAGTMPVSQVAVLYPRSAWLWDNATGGIYGPVGPHGTEDQGATAMDYMAVIAGLFRVIQQQHNIQVDFIDEDGLTAEGLAHHSALSEYQCQLLQLAPRLHTHHCLSKLRNSS